MSSCLHLAKKYRAIFFYIHPRFPVFSINKYEYFYERFSNPVRGSSSAFLLGNSRCSKRKLSPWVLIHFFICFPASFISSFFHYFDTGKKPTHERRRKMFTMSNFIFHSLCFIGTKMCVHRWDDDSMHFHEAWENLPRFPPEWCGKENVKVQ